MQSFKIRKLLLVFFLFMITATLSACNSVSNTSPDITTEEGYGGGGR